MSYHLTYALRENSQVFSMLRRSFLETVQTCISRANGDAERRFQKAGQIIIAGQPALA
jgi:hypothetical protein